MDPEIRRARRLAAHQRRASDHPLWELYGRPLVWPTAGLVLVLVAGWALVSAIGPRLGAAVSTARDEWPWLVLIFVSLLVLLWLARRLADPTRRGPFRRY